jgi:hypothetical protein
LQQSRLIYNEEGFTSSKDLENLTAGRYVDRLTISLKGEMTAGSAVTPATMSNLLNPLEVRLLGSPVIYLRGSDIWALNVLVLKKNPLTIVAGNATDNRTRIMGLEVPIQQPARGAGELTIKANRVAVSGVDTETITIAEITSDTALAPEYYHLVEIPVTTASSTGWGNFIDLPQPGRLMGILLYSTTIPTTTSDTATISEVMVVVNGSRAYHRRWLEIKADAATHDTLASPADASFIDNYAYIDFSKDPIPADAEVRLDINAGVASEAIRVIPVYLVTP